MDVDSGDFSMLLELMVKSFSYTAIYNDEKMGKINRMLTMATTLNYLPLDLVERFLTHNEELLLDFVACDPGEPLLLSASLSSSLLLSLDELPDWSLLCSSLLSLSLSLELSGLLS